MTKTLENQLKIANTSPELFLEAVMTLPVEPRYADFNFLAYGLSMSVNEEYLEECRRRNVMPARVELEYSSNKKLFLPSLGGKFALTYENEHNLANVSHCLKGILHGGKINEILIKTIKGEFKFFREGLLDNLLQEEYQLVQGDIWITTYRLGEYSGGGYARETGLSFGRRKGMELDIREGMDDVKAWFKKLQKKYS